MCLRGAAGAAGGSGLGAPMHKSGCGAIYSNSSAPCNFCTAARTAQWLQPVQASASIEGVETAILTEAAKRLNEMLAAECEAQTGIPVRVETELEQTPDGIRAARAILWMPPDSPAQVQTQLVQFLQKELSTDAVTAAEEAEP